MTSRWPVMTEPHRQQIDRYRCCDGHIGKRAGNFGMMGDMVHQYRNTGADGSGRGEDKVMREVTHKGAAQTVQHGMEAFAKIDRSAERRVVQEWVRTCRSRWSPYH